MVLSKFFRVAASCFIIIILSYNAYAMTLNEIMAPSFKVKEGALARYIAYKIDSINGNEIEKECWADLGIIGEQIKSKSISPEKRIELARSMLTSAIAGLASLKVGVYRANLDEYAKLFINQCALACSYLGLDEESINNDMKQQIIDPVYKYISSYIDDNTFRYVASDNDCSSNIEIELFPEASMAFTEFTSLNKDLSVSRWAGICHFDKSEESISCESTKKDSTKFKLIMKISSDALRILINDNFDKYLIDSHSGSVPYIANTYKRIRFDDFSS